MMPLIAGLLHVAYTTPALPTPLRDPPAVTPFNSSPCAYDRLVWCAHAVPHSHASETRGCLLRHFETLTTGCKSHLDPESELAMPRGYAWREPELEVRVPFGESADAASVLCSVVAVLLVIALVLSIAHIRHAPCDTPADQDPDLLDLTHHSGGGLVIDQEEGGQYGQFVEGQYVCPHEVGTEEPRGQKGAVPLRAQPAGFVSPKRMIRVGVS